MYNLAEYDKDEDMLFTQSGDIDVVPNFEKMGLKEDLLRGIYAYGTFSLSFIHSFQMYNFRDFLLG